MGTSLGQIITFYSYKGGVGRTFALADVGVILARWGYRVLCVDWDLEAPGLDVYFRTWLKHTVAPGLLELLLDYKGGDKIAWSDVVELPSIPRTNGRLGLLRAGHVDDSYAARVQQLDWDALYAQGFGRALETMRSEWQREYDVTLIDSRTGLSDIGGICTIQLPSVLATFFTPNDQSLEGILRVARGAQQKQKTLPIDRTPLRVVPVPTRVDSTEYEARRDWIRRITDALGPLIEEWSEVPQSADSFLTMLSVPYVPYWSYGERLPALTAEESGNRLSVGFAHETLAALLCGELANADELLKDREQAVAMANGTAGSKAYKYDVFVSYSRADANFAQRLTEAIQARHLAVYSEVEILPGDRWEEVVAASRASSRIAVIVVGHTISEYHSQEIAEFQSLAEEGQLQRRIIPILRSDVSDRDLPEGLSKYVSLSESHFDLDKLADEIARVAEKG